MRFLRQRLRSFGYAFEGLFDLVRHHPNAQIHLLAIVVVTTAGFYWGLERWEWVAVVLCFALVLALEALNSAVEYLTDLASPDYHPLAKKAKDIAAAAVLIAAMGAVVVAALVFIPKW